MGHEPILPTNASWSWIAILVITVAFVVVGGVVQPLAMAWLGVVAVSAFHQRREARASASSEAG